MNNNYFKISKKTRHERVRRPKLPEPRKTGCPPANCLVPRFGEKVVKFPKNKLNKSFSIFAFLRGVNRFVRHWFICQRTKMSSIFVKRRPFAKRFFFQMQHFLRSDSSKRKKSDMSGDCLVSFLVFFGRYPYSIHPISSLLSAKS